MPTLGTKVTFLFFEENGPRSLNSVELPTGRGKFIQMWSRAARKEYVVFASFDLFGSHWQILKSFCVAEGVRTSYWKKQGIWLPTDRDWEVGGGRWDYDREAGVLEIVNGSGSYGPSSFDDNLRAQFTSLPWLEGCEIRIE